MPTPNLSTPRNNGSGLLQAWPASRRPARPESLATLTGCRLAIAVLSLTVATSCSQDSSDTGGDAPTSSSTSSATSTTAADGTGTDSVGTSTATTTGTSTGGTAAGTGETGAAGPTWDAFAAAFFETYCWECHGPGDALRDYSQLAAVMAEADVIRCGTAPASMPPSGCRGLPPPEQFPIGDNLPTETERAMLVEWVEAGLP